MRTTTTFRSFGLLILSKKTLQILTVFAAFFICLSTNSVNAQSTATPKKNAEPVDPIREKQKQEYFAKKKKGETNSIANRNVQSEFSGEPLPDWNDTGDFEADKAAYLSAVEGWLERNAHLYSEEEIAFLKKPVLPVEERQQILNNN